MSFKVKQIGMVLAGCLLAGAAQAQGGQYAKLQLAIADVDGFNDDGVAAVGTFGMTLPQVDPNFSIEGELSFTIDDPEISRRYDIFGTTYEDSIEASYFTLAGYAAYTLPLNPSFGLYGRAGLLYEDLTVEVCDGFNNTCWEASEDDIGLSLGFGGNVAIGSNFDFTAGITIVEEDITHYSAGAQFRF